MGNCPRTILTIIAVFVYSPEDIMGKERSVDTLLVCLFFCYKWALTIVMTLIITKLFILIQHPTRSIGLKFFFYYFTVSSDIYI